jgi:hypothetical protein
MTVQTATRIREVMAALKGGGIRRQRGRGDVGRVGALE